MGEAWCCLLLDQTDLGPLAVDIMQYLHKGWTAPDMNLPVLRVATTMISEAVPWELRAAAQTLFLLNIEPVTTKS